MDVGVVEEDHRSAPGAVCPGQSGDRKEGVARLREAACDVYPGCLRGAEPVLPGIDAGR